MSRYKFAIICACLFWAHVTILSSCSTSEPFSPQTKLETPELSNQNTNLIRTNNNNSNTNEKNANNSPANSNVNTNKIKDDLIPVCVRDISDSSRTTCTLDGYEEKEYNFEDGKKKNDDQKRDAKNRKNAFINRVADVIESKKAAPNCTLLAVESEGYADSLKLEETALKLSDVPEFCRHMPSEYIYSANDGTSYLTNKGLAYARQCLIGNLIVFILKKRINIISEKWKPKADEFTASEQKGNEYRKVSIIIETSGSCP